MPRPRRDDTETEMIEGASRPGRMPGAYLILFRLEERRTVTIGRLGTFEVEAGWYAYAGSALNGLKARTERHLRACGKKRWHIDHLLPHAVERVAFLIPSERDIECQLARVIHDLGGTRTPIPGFGSSDCRCISHLFLLVSTAVPDLGSTISTGLGGREVIKRVLS